MPYQIKNGIIYSGNAVTLTQAQYDALTTAEKNNGTVYYIYDSDAMIEAQEVGLDGGNVEDLAGSVATFETSPSTAVHAAGEYILYQAQLYKVTSAIAVGEDLTVGSNIEATNLGNELNNGLTDILELFDFASVSEKFVVVSKSSDGFDALYDDTPTGTVSIFRLSSSLTAPFSSNNFFGFQWKNGTGNYGTQVVIGYTANNAIAIRTRSGGTWNNWTVK